MNNIDIKTVVDIVASELNTTIEELKKVGRKREIVEARHISFYILVRAFGVQKVEVARLFGMDHTSVIHGIRVQDSLMDAYPDYHGARYRQILNKVCSHFDKMPDKYTELLRDYRDLKIKYELVSRQIEAMKIDSKKNISAA